MNSFRTRDESLAILGRYPDLEVDGVPLDFVQSAEPKLRADDLSPVDWPADPELEWCPPGHGDVYLSLAATGLLNQLLDKGFRYVFLSNADNLGATCDPRIAAWLVENDVPYVAEVCDRTVNDRKGGHLAVRKSDGQLVLRDSAMVEKQDEDAFQDITRHTTFHANNLWVDLHAARRAAHAEPRPRRGRHRPAGHRQPQDRRPVRRRRRPRSSRSRRPWVARSPGSRAPGRSTCRARGSARSRRPTSCCWSAPTSSSSTTSRTIVSVISHAEPYVDLGKPYKLVPGFEQRFAQGVPSLREASSLRVEGDVTFGADVVCIGDVTVRASTPSTVPAGRRLTGVTTLGGTD